MRDAEKGLTPCAERIGTTNNARRPRRTKTNKPNTGTAAKTITNFLSDVDGGKRRVDLFCYEGDELLIVCFLYLLFDVVSCISHSLSGSTEYDQ